MKRNKLEKDGLQGPEELWEASGANEEFLIVYKTEQRDIGGTGWGFFDSWIGINKNMPAQYLAPFFCPYGTQDPRRTQGSRRTALTFQQEKAQV